MSIQIVGLAGLPEVRPGDDLAALIRSASGPLDAATIVVIAQKVVSKAENAIVDLRTVTPSDLAAAWASQYGKDPRLIELVLRQSRRIVKMDRGVIISETSHGFVAANAGVDQSNVPGEHFATILPADPDESARRIRESVGCAAVIISDTFGRPWREGLVNVAIGVSGLEPLLDLRGTVDRSGRPLQTSTIAIADELAAAAGLVMAKSEGLPVALITGFASKTGEISAKVLARAPEKDLFR